MKNYIYPCMDTDATYAIKGNQERLQDIPVMKSQEYIALFQIQQLNNACVDCEERGIHA